MIKTWCAGLAVLMCSAALAQYSNSDPRNSNPEYQRRQNELQQQEKDKEDRARSERQSAQDAESYRQFMDNQRKLQEKLSGDVERDRALLLKTPSVPPQKNLLLGQWRLVMPKKKSGNAIADFNATMAGGTCEMVFGDGIWDFRPKALYGIDAGIGETMLTEVDYRGNEGIVGVLPKKGKLFIFKILGPDRVQELTSTRIGIEPCTFVRVGGGNAAARETGASGARGASAGGGAAPSNAAGAPPARTAGALSAPPASPARPSQEVCRQTLLDKLGVIGVNQVRQLADARFREVLEGKVPNTQHLRIDARGSACDDARLNATLYDLDSNGMLQSITYVWARPAGPAPAPIFNERVATLARFHSLPPPQSTGRLQADTALGRLILQDMPERNLLLESYRK